MSVIVTVYVPSGIVVAADSRVVGARTEQRQVEGHTISIEHRFVATDYAYRIAELQDLPVGIGTYDTAVLQNEPVGVHIRRFEEAGLTPGDDVVSVPPKLVNYFHQRFPGLPVGFLVAGYRHEGKLPVPYVYACHTVHQTEPQRVNVDQQGNIQYGVLRGGDTQIINRLIVPEALPPFAALPLQDAVDYATFLVRTTAEAMRFEPNVASVGGPIDVLAITPDGIRWVHRKELRA